MRIKIIRFQDDGDGAAQLRALQVHAALGESVCVIQSSTAARPFVGPWPACLRMVLAGKLYLRSGGITAEFDDNAALCLDAVSGPHLSFVLGRETVLATLVPAPALLEKCLDGDGVLRGRGPLLLAAQHGRDSRVFWLLRQLCASAYVAREAECDDNGLLTAALREIGTAQGSFDAAIARCPGRAIKHRRELFARLNRVRLLLDADFRGAMSIAEMAALASASRTHFVRLYRRAFGLTPHRYLSGARLRQASALLAGSDIAVRELATRLGFENRCAFARWYRQEAGLSASAARRSLRAGNEADARSAASAAAAAAVPVPPPGA